MESHLERRLANQREQQCHNCGNHRSNQSDYYGNLHVVAAGNFELQMINFQEVLFPRLGRSESTTALFKSYKFSSSSSSFPKILPDFLWLRSV